MSANRLKGIVDALLSQLREIDGTGNYNYTLWDSDVILAWRDFNQPPNKDRYPFISVFEAEIGPSSWMDIRTEEYPFEIRGYGFVRVRDNDPEILEAAFKLASDIEEAIFSDPQFGDRIYELSDFFEVTALGASYAGVFFEVTGKTSLTHN